jgi:hypothetical protein
MVTVKQNPMKFTKTELKVIHDNFIHNLAMLNAVSILENDGLSIHDFGGRTEEAKIINSILKKCEK